MDQWSEKREFTRPEMVANRVMVVVIRNAFGVDRETLKRMRDLKRALVEDWGDEPVRVEFIDQLHTELTAMAEGADRELVAAETKEARRQYCIHQGIKPA